MTPEQKYIELYEEMANLCAQEGGGDPFSYARSKEILTAIKLGHTVAETLSGADAINENGEEVEYKSTTGKKVQGSYTGISVQGSWAEQERYLREEKILKYPEHYYSRYDGGQVAEVWKLSGQQVFDILLPKLRKNFLTVSNKKDPRLSATVTNREIRTHGTRVL